MGITPRTRLVEVGDIHLATCPGEEAIRKAFRCIQRYSEGARGFPPHVPGGGTRPRYPLSTVKGTCISVLKIAKIEVNVREICRSVKVEKRVPFLSEIREK